MSAENPLATPSWPNFEIGKGARIKKGLSAEEMNMMNQQFVDSEKSYEVFDIEKHEGQPDTVYIRKWGDENGIAVSARYLEHADT